MTRTARLPVLSGVEGNSSKSGVPARALRAGGLVRHSLGGGGLILLLGAAFAFASVARAAEEG